MTVVIKIAIAMAECIYSILRRFPLKKKIVYISRQSDDISIDFQLLSQKIMQYHPEFEHVFLCKMIQKGILKKIGYCLHMCRQMYHIATARVVILDGYCILISVLHHRRGLLVIQLWHALGALKKFGYSILDKPEGKSSKIAKLMKMHNNYSYIFTSGEPCRRYFSEAFNQPIEKVRAFPLPRVDLLLSTVYKEEIKEKIYNVYPRLENSFKKVIVYAPTFRENDKEFRERLKDLSESIDYSNYEFIVKFHPLTKFEVLKPEIICDELFSSTEMLSIADYIITDYSAIIFEAMLLKKPVLLFAFDYEDYCKKRDFYIDYEKSFSPIMCKNVEQLIKNLQREDYDIGVYQNFIENMVRKTDSSYTVEICDFIEEHVKIG